MSVASRLKDQLRRVAHYAARYQHGFATMAEFRAWQEREIVAYTGTPEALARRSVVEAQLAEGWVPWHPHSDVFFKGESTPAPLNHLLEPL